jgi:hypothetical protein
MRSRGARLLASIVLALALPAAILAAATPVAAADSFLHSSTTDTLDQSSPAGTTAKYKDSPAINHTT